jgi:cholesterol oxidase
MTGCRYNAKTTLDKNYLYLAQQLGAKIIAEKEVFNVESINDKNTSKGYKISYKASIGRKNKESITAKGVIFSGGVMGTIPLLLKLKETSLPNLSNFVGKDIRTNNESLLSVTSTKDDDKDYSKGVSIGSILHTDKNSHLEPVRYAKGSSFFKLMTIPTVKGKYGVFRILGVLGILITKPFYILKTFFTKKYAEKTTVLLFMQTLDSTLQIKRGAFTQMKTIAKKGEKPNAFIPEAITFSKKVGKKINGIPYSNFTDVLLGTTTTAHILGGAVMGEDIKTGVIDENCNVFG